ncbi:hypothetical protein DEM27_12710 [Metarhizobium album]|uniref:Uncharacterized protein n=1 Tax=Metarhizobium album TaxID=2182425 RepID=A0A2U2DSH1_9HYPH|nr:hypothetical protein DEM27_12710 [Rhizobium album]
MAISGACLRMTCQRRIPIGEFSHFVETRKRSVSLSLSQFRTQNRSALLLELLKKNRRRKAGGL